MQKFILAPYFALLALSVLPVLAFAYPPLVDYLNHLARLHIILNPDDPVLNQFYRIEWRFLPNLGMDLFGLALGEWLGVGGVGKAYLLLVIVVFTSAAPFLSYVLFGRVTAASLGGFLVLYNYALNLGTLNYLLACGLAIWAFGAYLLLVRRTRYLHAAVGTVMGLGLLMVHLYGLGIYAVLVGMQALSELKWGQFRELAVRASQFILPVGAFFFLSPVAGGDGPGAPYLFDWTWKVLNLAHLTMFDGPAVRAAVSALVLFLIVLAVRHWRTAFHKHVTAAVFVLLGLYTLVPPFLLSGSNVDWRLLIPLALVACGALTWTPATRRGEVALLGFLILAVGLQSVYVHQRWARADAHQAHVAALLKALPEGSKIFPVFFGGGWKEAESPIPWPHMSAVGVIERNHFLPSLFAFKTQQPLNYTPAYEPIRQNTRRVVYGDPAHVDWTTVERHFDYVLVMDPNGEAQTWRAAMPLATQVLDATDPHVLLMAVRR